MGTPSAGSEKGVPFQYARVPADYQGQDWIRIVALFPAKKFERPLSCGVFYVLVDELKRHRRMFEALSYTWGSEQNKQKLSCETIAQDESGEFTRPIAIRNTYLEITENLDIALRYLRRKKTQRLLYIDAICINQQDLEEKQTQIQLMSAVFSFWTRVVVWLGKSDSDVVLSFRSAKILYSIDTKVNRVAFSWLSPTIHRTKLAERIRQALVALTGRAWFHRLWTLQEGLIPEDIVFACGHLTVGIKEIITLQVWADKSFRRTLGSEESLSSLPGRLDSRVWFKQLAVRVMLNSNLGGSSAAIDERQIPSLLLETKRALVKEQKDKVFGTVALAKALAMPLPNISYMQNVEEVYALATQSWVSHLGSIACLGLAVTPKMRSDLPTWAVDWSHSPWQDRVWYDSILWLRRGSTVLRLRHPNHESASCAAKYTTVFTGAEQSVSATSLFLRGVILKCDIDRRYAPVALGVAPDSAPDTWFQRVALEGPRLSHFLGSAQLKHGETADIYGQIGSAFALFHGLAADEAIDVSILREDIRRMVDALSRVPEDILSEGPDWTRYMMDVVKFWDEKSKDHVRKGIFRLLHAGVYTFFTTTAGQIGLCFCVEMRIGDRLAVVAGSDFPIVLRSTEVEGEWALIGFAYVHSLMDGSAWPQDRKDLETIVLV